MTIKIETHELIIHRFVQLLRHNRLAHAYLFVGPRKIGKTRTAITLAKMINCEAGDFNSTSFEDQQKTKGPCEQCPACLKINSFNHPDVRLIDSQEESSIKIAKIRELIEKIQLTPYEAKMKIYILRDIENLTLEGSNALLKTLEEPPAKSLLILTTSFPEKVISTIRSRCYPIHFFPIPKEKLSAHLSKHFSDNKDYLHCLTYLSEGNLGKAQHFIHGGFLDRKNEIIDNLLFQRNNDLYLKEVLTDKDRTKELLSVLLTCVRDLFLLKLGVPQDQMIHQDRMSALLELETRLSRERLVEILKQTTKALKMLEENLNIKIPMILLKEKIWAR